MILLFFLLLIVWAVWSIYHFVVYRPRSVHGKVVLITGACSVVGRQFCQQFHKLGATVIAWDYGKLKLEELQRDIVKRACPASNSSDGSDPLQHGRDGSDECDSLSGDAIPFRTMAVDLASRLQVQRAAKELGQVDIIIHAAHLVPRESFVTRSEEAMDRILQTNLVTPLVLAKQLIPGMLQRKMGGQVVTLVTSSSGLLGSSQSPEYTASQWGAVGMHYSIREWTQEYHRANKSAGAVKTTLLYLDSLQRAAPGASSRTTKVASSIFSRRGPSSQHTLEGAQVCEDASTASTAVVDGQLTVETAVSHCMQAICRGSDRLFIPSRLALHSLFLLLPVPWSSWMIKVARQISGGQLHE